MLDCVLTGSFSQIWSQLKDPFSLTGVKDYCLAHSSADNSISTYLIAGGFYFSLQFVKGVPGLLHTPLSEIFRTSLYVGKILANATR
jgi:hypothetical protein